jgi:hypothetical protein
MDIGPEGITLQEIELSPEELKLLKKSERLQTTLFFAYGLLLSSGIFGPMLYRDITRKPGDSVTGSPFVTVVAWSVLTLLYAIPALIMTIKTRAISTCRVRYKILQDGLRMEVLREGPRRSFRKPDVRMIPWWKVSSTLGESDLLKIGPTSPESIQLPERCFQDDDQKAIFVELAYKG